MAREFNDLYDLNNLDDAELKDLVLQQLNEHPDVDVDLVEVEVNKGAVRLAGRIGTEQELQTVEHVLTDTIGLSDVQNDMVVDEVVRAQRSEAADDALVEDREADPQYAVGTAGNTTSDTAQHLVEDLEAEQFGTHNMQEATERGTAYEPPDRPTSEGTRSREDH